MAAWNLGPCLAALHKLLASANEQRPRGSSVDNRPWSKGMGPVCALGITAGAALGPALYHQQKAQLRALEALAGTPWAQVAPLPFASISSAAAPPQATSADSDAVVTEPATGLPFPRRLSSKKPCCRKSTADDNLLLSGLGIRSKKLFGLANIKVYAYGVYVDAEEIKKALGEKYKGLPPAALHTSKWLLEDLLQSDTPLNVRLVISYKGLKIGQVRSAFTESVGGRLEAITGAPQPEVLNSFTKWFTDDIILHRGTIIDLKRGPGHVLTTQFDGKTAGTVTSSLLTRALFSLYLGDKPFDPKAKDAVKDKLVEVISGAF